MEVNSIANKKHEIYLADVWQGGFMGGDGNVLIFPGGKATKESDLISVVVIVGQGSAKIMVAGCDDAAYGMLEAVESLSDAVAQLREAQGNIKA